MADGSCFSLKAAKRFGVLETGRKIPENSGYAFLRQTVNSTSIWLELGEPGRVEAVAVEEPHFETIFP